ncbi:polysaccharide biosynthesis C-terminal domain-containing protein [Nocardioides sp. WV_118_6]|uniref:polysaccharide biosynthesis C-terminal domain-containing protein n=1 Tax=Nocardioides simplex TaxID=2045 RepID=UPI00214F700B|nr:polysaccharide biosynthesis C-terminal domain-containing protein [Pimelobacter simplex]UUW90295.1 polysaccharide biosynthesis C-terminal domain-containing protein [Pimelobacter simplex]UUW94125.1 polysaccharide biosynthesis C-terminal domain-containing protein [Pimelobacter simplex]
MKEVAGERRHLRAVARGSAATLAGAVLSTLAGFGLVLVVTRSVTPDTAGRFFAVTAVFLVALAAAGLGTDTGLARFVLRDDRPEAVRALVRTAAVPVLATAVLLALALGLWWPDARALMWALPLAAATDLCLAAVRAHALFRATVLIDRIVRPAVQIAFVAVAILLHLPGAGLAAAWGAAYAVSAVLALGSLRHVVGRGRRGAGAGAARDDAVVGRRDYWRFTAPRAIARIAQVGVQRLDIVLVAWLLSPTDAAVYTVATRFVVFGQLANQAVSSVVQPRFTMILATEADDAPALVSRVFGVSTCWSVLLAWPVYLAVAAAPAAYLGWFGASYTKGEAVVVAVVMAAGMLLAVASGPVDTLLLMTGRSGLSLANTLVALALDVGLCLLLVPRIGIAGAAVAWVIAVVVRCVLAVLQLRADIGLRLPVADLVLAAALPIGCVGVPVALLALVAGLSPIGWLVATAVAGLGYAAVVWRLRTRLAVDVFVTGFRSRRRLAVAA